MKDEYWRLNLLNHTVFLMALHNVWSLFDETDDYPLARQVAMAGFIKEEEGEGLINRIGECDFEKPLKMPFADILLLYTAMDLNAKLMISHKGDKIREELKLDDNP